MKTFNLKIIIIFLVFSFGIGSVWSFGGFSYLVSLFKQKPAVSQVLQQFSKTPNKLIPSKIENTFLQNMPRFEDYPVTEIYKGNIASLEIAEDDFDRERLQWAIDNQEVNFAGHYIFTDWSCGMWCKRFEIVDAKTGKVYGLDVSPQVCLPHLKEEFVCNENFKDIDYRIDSNLLILFGIRYENNPDGERGFHYYRFENGNLLHLKSELTKEQRSVRQIQVDEFDEKNNKKLDCNNLSEYDFVIVENPNRRIDGYSLIPKDLNIVTGENVISKIELPTADSEAKNFSLNSVEKDKFGFELKVEWGGGNYHYEIQYNFKCRENNFYLYKVKNENFSTTNPDSGNFWDKKETKVTKIEPNIPIEKFVMSNYLW